MNANKGVVLAVSVLAVSVAFCQAQVIAEVVPTGPQFIEAPGAVLSNPLGPVTQVVAPEPVPAPEPEFIEVLADASGAALSNPIGPVTQQVAPEPQLTEVSSGKRRLRGNGVADSEGVKGARRLLTKF